MTDQQRADALGCAGNPIVQTPNIDGLAAGGSMFTNAYVQCPVCMASRAAIHTGRYPRQLRMPSMGILPPDEITIAETLRRAGYATGMFGKLHFTPQSYTHQTLGSDKPLDVDEFLGAAGVDSPWARLAAEDPMKKSYGFDESIGVEDSLWGHWLDWLERESPEYVPHAVAENWGPGRAGIKYGANPPATRMFHPTVGDFFDSHIPAELSASRYIVDRSIDFIRRNANKPFFVHCSFVDPHHPFNAPEPYSRMYDPADMVTPRAADREQFPSSLRGKAGEDITRMHGFSDDLWRWARANYYGMVSNIDDCVGRLVTTLDELGLRDNTVIVFIADHGEYVGGHRLLYKGSYLFDDIMRVPFIINGPGVGGVQVDDLVQEIDVYPTIMSFVGLPIHAGVQGHDLTSLISGRGVHDTSGEQPQRNVPPWGELPENGVPGAEQPVHMAAPGYDRVYCETDDLPDPHYVASVAVRTREWKLNYFPHSGSGMMFNLKDDPEETINLYNDPGYAERQRELTGELLDMYDVMKDPLPHRLTQA